MKASLRILPLALLAATACQQTPSPEAVGATVAVAEDPEWMEIASSEDIDRLGRTASAWTEALAAARAAGATRRIADEGKLLEPEAGLPRPEPAPGSYNCRVLKLGAPGKGKAFQAFSPFYCYVGVEGELLAITKQGGSERPGGYLWRDTDRERMIFLGSLALGDEEAPAAYGKNPKRDMAGVFERVGLFRYRLVVPSPREEAKLIVIEFVPAPVQPKEE